MREKKLNLLVVSQYFWPENMRINDLVEDFVSRGYNVTVLTGLPNYPEGKVFLSYTKNKHAFNEYKGAKVIRIPMFPRGKHSLTLILNYLSFFLSASSIGLFKLRNKKFDAIFVYAVSPIMVAIPAILIGRLKTVPIFLWVLDLWPETLSAVGAVKNAIILKVVGRLVSWIYNRVDYILLQSNSFKTNILSYCTRPISKERLIYFPSWVENILANSKNTIDSKLLIRDNAFFTVIFTGNIGEAQDFPTIIEVFDKLKKSESIRLVIVGDGRLFEWVSNEVKSRQLTNVILLGRHPVTEMPGLIACADALLVSLKKENIFSKTIPGKLQAYLASGKPILGIIDGEAANIITKSRGGLVCASGDVDSFIANICKLSKLPAEDRDSMGQNGIEYYNQHFQAKKIFDKLDGLFKAATRRYPQPCRKME